MKDYKSFKFLFPIGLIGMTMGVVLSRALSKCLGLDGNNIIMTLVLIGLSYIIVYLIFIRQYLSALISGYLSIPIVVGGIGLLLDNMHLIDLGLVLLFIMYIPPIIYKKAKLKKQNK